MSDGDMVEAVARAILECMNQAPVPDEEWRKVMAGDANDVATLMSWGRAALSVIESREGWQPIATAPKERDSYSWSPTFLAWYADYGDPFPCKQRDGTFYDLELVDRDGDWQSVVPSPTHWRPLPSPPIRNGEG